MAKSTLNKTEKCESTAAKILREMRSWKTFCKQRAQLVSTGGQLTFGLEPWWTCQLIKAKWSGLVAVDHGGQGRDVW